MKKIVVLISMCLLLLNACSISKYPSNYPKMIIEYNNEKYDTEVNEVTWAETNIKNQSIGSSLISKPELDVATEMNSIEVEPNTEIKLKLGYDKNISEIYAIKVEGLGENRKESPVDIENNSIKVPNDKGEYVYSVKVIWDSTPSSTHFASYVIKLKVI